MPHRIRTIGGAGAASTSTAVVTAAVVEWGPNFGSTRQFAEEETFLATSYTAASTQVMTEEERLRPWQYQTDFPTALHHEGSFTTFVTDLGVTRSLTEEEHAAFASADASYRPMSEEGHITHTEVPTYMTTAEMVLRLIEQNPSYLNTQESLVQLALLQFGGYTLNEEGHLQGTMVFFHSSNGVFIVPGGTTVATMECYGGGAGGGNGGALNGGAGGGGGAYSLATGVTVTPNATMTVTVGGPSTGNGIDSWIGTSATILAKGGTRGGDNGGAAGAGGTTAAGVGTLKFNGGPGSANSGAQGGGGGGGAGTTTNGKGSGSTAGGAGGAFGGGAGGRGGNAAQIGGNGNIFGGAGGGGGNLSSGGAGVRGAALITVVLST